MNLFFPKEMRKEEIKLILGLFEGPDEYFSLF
jgi:hypothetical protein